MSLSPEQVAAIARLARLRIGADVESEFVRNLSGIIEFIAQLERVDTGSVSPMAHPLDTVQRMRPDEVTEVDERDRFQANAAAVEAGLYLVPKVIE